MKRERIEGQLYQTRAEVMWRGDRREMGALMVFVRTEGSSTLGWVLRREDGLVRLLEWYRGDSACSRVVEALVYLERQEESTGEPVVYCADRRFFGDLKQMIRGGGELDCRCLDQWIVRCLRENAPVETKSDEPAHDRQGLLARARIMRSNGTEWP